MTTTTFKLPIGDWSGDGHDKCDWYVVESNKPLQEVREAYFSAKKKLPTICPEGFMCQYEDHSLPKSVYEDALKVGWDFLEGYKYDPKYAEHNDGPPVDGWRDQHAADMFNRGEMFQYPDMDHKSFAEYVVWYIQQGDPDLVLTMRKDIDMLPFYGQDDQRRHIKFMGYGLF